MSVISFPRRVDTRRPPTRRAPATRPASHRADAPRRGVATKRWRTTSSTRKSAIVVVLALMLSLAGSMFEANRQIEIHALQSQLLQEQSTYAVQVGSLTNLSAPSQIATQAGALHLVDPTSVTQVPSTSLDAPLPLPKFLGYAPATSRTLR
ncbi:MAG TPA: hypothetical protein VGZ04_03415 [Acidimicrobiales bacterium]|nr:hypothetical protein [Acidimicrobiales bacterium]